MNPGPDRAVTIERLDGLEGTIADWVVLQLAVRAVDAPNSALPAAARVRGDLEHPWPGARIEQWLARVDGRLAGILVLGMRLTDNTDITVIRELAVHPDYRRQGVGTLLWRHAIAQSLAAGRHRLLVETTRPLDRDCDPGEEFVTATGAARVTMETGHQLAIADLDEAGLRGRLASAEAASSDYSLVRWAGPTPEAFVDGMARMAARMTTDVPMDDLDWQPEVWDAERVRSRDAIAVIRETRSYTTAARHDPTGELAGYTSIDLPAGNHAFGWQEATLVVPGHRGHRLGLRLKIENLAHVLRHEPALEIVETANADVNDHMIAINRVLGFRPIARHSEWELKLAGAR
jgi:GNAT superfamily N-acetyltransferase